LISHLHTLKTSVPNLLQGNLSMLRSLQEMTLIRVLKKCYSNVEMLFLCSKHNSTFEITTFALANISKQLKNINANNFLKHIS